MFKSVFVCSLQQVDINLDSSINISLVVLEMVSSLPHEIYLHSPMQHLWYIPSFTTTHAIIRIYTIIKAEKILALEK